MFNISFEINGRKTDPRNIANVLEAAALKQVELSIRNSVGSLLCREHGQAPRILVKGNGLKNLSFEVSGCCESLIGEVKSKFR